MESLKALAGEDNKYSIDVSSKQDGSIMAYYDSQTGNVYVYSEDLIEFNSDSSSMFYNLTALANITFGKVDTSNVTKMNRMFLNCSKLTSLDVNNFDTSKVIDMSYMFQFCSGLTSLNVSNFNTSQVTTIAGMFYGCCKLTSLDLSSFNTSNVTIMRNMFAGCKSLTILDLSSFDTSSVTNMYAMFHQDSKLKSILVTRDKWVINAGTNTASMFLGCGTQKVTYADA